MRRCVKRLKRCFLNLQQMTIVIRPSCWKRFWPKWVVCPCPGTMLLFLNNRWFWHILSTQVSDTGPMVLWFRVGCARGNNKCFIFGLSTRFYAVMSWIVFVLHIKFFIICFYTPPHKKWRGIILYPPKILSVCPSRRTFRGLGGIFLSKIRFIL